MKHFENYERVIAIKERSRGNDTVGDMWLETKSFARDAPISEVVNWARDASGRLIITIDESMARKYDNNFDF